MTHKEAAQLAKTLGITLDHDCDEDAIECDCSEGRLIEDGIEHSKHAPGDSRCSNFSTHSACSHDIARLAAVTTDTRLYTYTIKTDACEAEIEAGSMDEAARIFAEDELPKAKVTGVESLLTAIYRIGDGAWCWIESDDDPDGARRGGHYREMLGDDCDHD